MTGHSVPLSHTAGPDTERAGAASMVGPAQRMRRLVFDVLCDHPGGITDDEGAALLWAAGHLTADRLTFGRRRHELVLDELAEDSGERRPTPTGRSAVVWRVAPRLAFPDGTVDRALAD